MHGHIYAKSINYARKFSHRIVPITVWLGRAHFCLGKKVLQHFSNGGERVGESGLSRIIWHLMRSKWVRNGPIFAFWGPMQTRVLTCPGPYVTNQGALFAGRAQLSKRPTPSEQPLATVHRPTPIFPLAVQTSSSRIILSPICCCSFFLFFFFVTR